MVELGGERVLRNPLGAINFRFITNGNTQTHRIQIQIDRQGINFRLITKIPEHIKIQIGR